MSYQDLQVNLTGKDVSASDAFRSLARAAAEAARSTEGSLVQMARKVATETDTAYAEATAKLAKARRLATIESAKSFDDMGNKIAQSASMGTGQFGSRLTSWAQSGLAGILGGVAASVANSVTTVVSDAGQAIMGELKSTVIDYNSQLENATIGFTTMLGSGGKATDFLNTLQAFAQRTPFQFGDLTQYAQQMIGYGIKSKDVIKDLSALGDAASGTGRLDTLGNAVLAFEQMAARGKVDLGDLNQLSNAGVPALKILANQYGVSTGQMLKMISTGKVMSADALPKLTKGIEEGTKSTAKFGGMMDKQSGTFTGAMSNIQDSLSQTLSTAFKPFYKMVENVAVGLSKFATSKAVQKWAKDASAVVGQALHIIGNGFQQVFGDPKMQKAMGRLGSALGSAFKGIGPALQKMMPDLVKFGTDVFPAIVDGITTVVKHFPQFMKGVEGMVKELATWGPAVAQFIKWGAGIIGWLIDTVSAFQQWHRDATAAIVAFFRGFQGWLGDIGRRLAGFAGTMAGIGGHIIGGLVGGIRGAWHFVTDAVSYAVNLIPLAARKLLGIASPSKVFHQIGTHVGEGLRNGLLGSVSQVQSAAAQLSTAVVAQFKSGAIGREAEHVALTSVTRMSLRLQSLAKQRDAVNTSLTNLRTDRSNLATGVRTSTLGQGNITGFAAVGDAVEGLQVMIRNTKQFKGDLYRLRRMGVGQTMFRQLVDAWQSDPANALRTADELVANPVDLKEIVGLQRQLGAASLDLGNYAGAGEYGAAINQRAGQSRVLTWEMQKTAASGLRRVASETHIHLHLAGTYAGTKTDLAKTVYSAFRDAVKTGAIPKNAYVNP